MKQVKSNNEKQAQKLERIRNFRLLDDDFMSKYFEDNIECTELVLNIVMGKSDLQVKEVRTQYTIKNLQGRSVRLDIFATDDSGKKYNIEVQRTDNGAGAKRARYNSSIIDANLLLSGDNFEDIPETYVIFITENDVIGDNLPIYHIERCITENGKMFGDGSHILYVNAKYKDDTPLGKLMHDFSCANPSDMNYEVLAKRAKYLKEDKEGVINMCKAMEELIQEEIQEEKVKTVMRMLEMNKNTKEEIAQITELTVKDVEEIASWETV